MDTSRVPRFAERLIELRKKASLTQQQVAERAGIHKLTVAKLEQGIREPSWATVLALANALDVNCLAFAENDAPSGPPRKRPRGRPPKATPAMPPAEDLEAMAKKSRGRKGKGK
jgi:transcriptional regulator with XRE-family HTH domain